MNGDFEHSICEWFALLLKMKNQGRQGWADRGLDGDSIADHSFGCVVIGWLLAHEEGGDAKRIYEMLIIHEMVMAKMPDVTPASTSYNVKEDLEHEAAIDIASLLQESIRNDYLSLFAEYQAGLSREAVIAGEAAKLETLLQGEALEIRSGRSDIVPSLLSTYSGRFKTPTGRKLLEGVRARHASRLANS